MNFNSFFLKSFRILLLPFSIIYGLLIILRNFFYDKNYLKSAEFNFPLICVGNLAVGGTGKSPMVEYIAEVLLRAGFEIATLSRGYKRKTRGYLLAGDNTTAIEIGDEPMQFHQKFPGMSVAVGEERIVAIPQILHDRPQTEVIILDDAFQHRAVKPGFNILLTQYKDLFTQDFFLPTGDLRDQPASYKRAEVIIVTKCPSSLSGEERIKIRNEINPLPHQHLFFTSIEYGLPYHIISKEKRNITPYDEVLLVCGIANPKPLKQFLADNAYTYYQQDYSDHHIFTIDDLREITRRYRNMSAENKFILTTEKDAVRLIKFHEELLLLPLYVLPIRHRFLFEEGRKFDELVINYINHFQFKPKI